MRKNKAFDILNKSVECHIRQGYDGKTHVRGPAEMLDGGKDRVRPIWTMPFWDFDTLRDGLKDALGQREVGSSSVHDPSSRTQTVLELEIVTQQLVDVRDVVIERESELVPVGEEGHRHYGRGADKGVIRLPGGGWTKNPV